MTRTIAAATRDTATTVTTAQPTTSGVQTLNHLRDGDIFTEADADGRFAISLGDRAELRLSNDHTWTAPALVGPGELAALHADPNAGYSAWELVPSAQGSIVISATGTPDCAPDCDLEPIDFAVSISVRQR